MAYLTWRNYALMTSVYIAVTWVAAGIVAKRIVSPDARH